MELRLPNITGATEREQLSQVRSYLYQLVDQLQFTISKIEEIQIAQEEKIKELTKGDGR
jgi:hypothetical protein